MVCYSLFSQSGYIGSLNAVNIDFNGITTQTRTIKIKVKGNDSTRVAPLRYVIPAFSIGYSRILGNRIEATASYQFANVKSHLFNSNINLFHNQKVLNEIKGRQHNFSLDFKYYIRGSIAGVGKYFGFRMQYGVLSFNENELLLGKLGNTTESSFFVKRANILSQNYDIETESARGTSLSLRVLVGRSYPITERLVLNLEASLPLLSRYSTGLYTNFGYEQYGEINDSFIFDPYNLDKLVIRTSHIYQRASFKVGIKFHF